MQTLTSDSIPQARHLKFRRHVSYDRRTITGKSFMNEIAATASNTTLSRAIISRDPPTHFEQLQQWPTRK